MSEPLDQADPFEMSHDALVMAVVQFRRFAQEAKELAAMVAEATGESLDQINGRLAGRLAAKKETQS